jgi:hypothetical protein
MLTITNPNDPTKNGYYNFEVCQIGTYFIKVRKGSLYDFVTPNQGLDDAIDSDIIDFDNESTLTFTVGYAVTIADIDAGLKSKVLPIQLKEFTGRWNQFRDINELTWITLSEINNDYFNLERSVNGSEFEVIATSGDGINATEKGYFTGDYSYDGSVTVANDSTPVCDPRFNLRDQKIYLETCEGTKIYLGTKNKLSSVNYTGGDTGGGNATITYSYTTFNDFVVAHSGGLFYDDLTEAGYSA